MKCFCPHDERDGRLDEMANDRNSKSKSYPLVTVFVGCYNHSRFVEECLDSVRHQTYPNLQVIIFDDCSNDNSVSVINGCLKKHRLDWPFISHNRNIGICASLNEVLRLARGKYISMVAADDGGGTRPRGTMSSWENTGQCFTPENPLVGSRQAKRSCVSAPQSSRGKPVAWCPGSQRDHSLSPFLAQKIITTPLSRKS